MGTLVEDFRTPAAPSAVWAAIADVGAVHTRLAPGFVVACTQEPGARTVTFANGTVVREPIVAVDEVAMRVVWTAEGGRTRHYNAALQVFAVKDGGSRVVWTVDFLPDDLSAYLEAAMRAGVAAMRRTLDRLA